MAGKKVQEIPIPIQKKLWRLFIKLLKYPRRVDKRYARYNGAISEILYETGNENLDVLRKRNAKLVNIFIRLPLIIGIIGSIVSLFLHWSDFNLYFEKAFASMYYKGFFSGVAAYIKRIYFIVTAIPLNRWDYLSIILGQFGSIIGAWFLSQNPAFDEEARIIHIFSTLGYIDSEGQPWKVTWTPDAVLIEAFNCDPYALCSNTRFWSSVNFPPSQPKVFKDNMNKFIVQRKYELPNQMIFEIKGGNNE